VSGAWWNRFRYTIWAPVYDAVAGAARFDGAVRRSIDRLQLGPGERVLLMGAGTGLDLDYLPADADITAIDLTPAMLKRLHWRAARAGKRVMTRVMDARRLEFPDATFDAVVMHLILAVMPDPELGLREAERVLKPGGRVAVFDKFLRQDETASPKRRIVNLIARPLFSDLNRRLEPLVAHTRLIVENDEPAAFGGMYRVVTLVKPESTA